MTAIIKAINDIAECTGRVASGDLQLIAPGTLPATAPAASGPTRETSRGVCPAALRVDQHSSKTHHRSRRFQMIGCALRAQR